MATYSDPIPYEWAGTTVTLNYSRDALITPFAKETLRERYLWPNENFQQMFARVAIANSNDQPHAQRLYDYISKFYFMPSTPVLSNSGHPKNLQISCYLNAVGDSLEEINKTLSENFWLAARGGGIGTSWSEVRDIGEGVGEKGKTSGIIPFIKMQDSATLGISQGNLRRGSAAVYLDVSHPEIEEFIDIRRPQGDPNRKSLNIHHGVNIPNAFMNAVKDGTNWELKSPHTGEIKATIKARDLWQKIITSRLETGEPYLWFIDNVNEQRPDTYKANGLFNKQSNLCSEISLSTGIDYNNKRRTAVCCLSSLNLETYSEWENDPQFIEDVMYFLDNVMSSFIDKTEGLPGFERANYAARMERSIGLGVMGFHSFLQSKMIPIEGVMAKVWNKRIHQSLKQKADIANRNIAFSRGPCPDAQRVGIMKRFSHMFAIAPTASISIIAGESSPGIEPYVANSYTQKTLSGQFEVRNKFLDKLLNEKYLEMNEWEPEKFDGKEYTNRQKKWVDSQWQYITANKGSVQPLEYLTSHEQDVFKTAMEINQEWLLEHAADRQPFICQGQSLNLFLPATIEKKVLNALHFKAWKLGLKGLYYARSRSIQQATNTAGELPSATVEPKVHLEFDEGDECLSCQ